MNLLLHHQQKAHLGEEDQAKGSPQISCPHCGRKLMERKGPLHRLKPISNAFVVYGNCLACSGENDAMEEEKHEAKHEKQEKEEKQEEKEDI